MASSRSTGWMPVAGGVLSIIAGVFGILKAFVAFLARLIGGGFFRAPFFFGLTGTPSAIIAVVAILGGYYAVQRKLWGLALVGAICALFTGGLVIGILAIIFIAVSKREFN